MMMMMMTAFEKENEKAEAFWKKSLSAESSQWYTDYKYVIY